MRDSPLRSPMIARGVRARGSRFGVTLDAVYECTYHRKRRIGPPPLANAGTTRKGMKREYDFSKAKRGPVVKVPKGKTRITIRLDDDVLAWFQKQVDEAGGGNHQTLINSALRRYVEYAEESIEKIVRRLIREELRRAS